MKPELEFFQTINLPLQLTARPDGLESEIILAHDTKTGNVTKISYYAPGYHQTEAYQKHDYWYNSLPREEVYILAGRIQDRTLDRWIEAGEYACRPPGMIHGPYTADPEVGVRQLLFLHYDPK
ncbi:cupin 2 domain-containing protein [Naematelia encephala]|uniref:Cupin 2 domain-containing protein n=1 Tax=Naematelia encephala TaxID=71784 RepID=A0A1Y2AU32_9TREE|nr:cupin 2 domain-containing protein [Naematelia encephala]